MKNAFHLLNIFLILFLFQNTSQNLCQDDELTISALGKCEKIEDFLENENLTIKTENLFYLAFNNEGKITKNGYQLEIYKLNDTKLQSHNMRKSKLYIPQTCMEKMEKNEEIKLDKNKGVVILVSNFNNTNKNNIPDNYFIIRHNSASTNKPYINSKNYDFNFCNKDPILYENEINISDLKYNYANDEPIDIDTILYGKRFGIDLFDPYNDFFNDICFKFTSEKGTDVTLDSRVEDYYQNITFCDDKKSSHYLSYNYSEKTNIITYRCAYGFYENEKDKHSYLDIIDTELKTFASVSNIKVITCFRQFLNLRDVVANYGGMICILVLFIQIICFLIFCFKGIKSIRKQIDDLFNLGNEIIKKQSTIFKDVKLNIEKEEREESNEKILNTKEINDADNIRQSLHKENTENTENKENTEKKAKRENTDDKLKEKEKKETNEKLDKKILEKNKEEKDALSFDSINKKVKSKDFDKETNIDVKSENSILYDYNNDELNEMPFDKAIKHDKRNFCSYYCNMLLISHILLNVFCRQSDYNLFVVKLGLLLMTFPINLTFNILFFTNKKLKLTYIKSMNDISFIWDNMANSVYSSILSSTFLIILKLICLTHNSVRALRKIKDVKLAKEKSKCVFRCIKLRIFIYYILSFAFILVFGFYVLSFCAIFENTQIVLIKSTFTSWVISLIYPFIIFLIASFIRSLSYSCKSKCLYAVKQILQWF